MSYTPNTWATGDTITADKLNNMEQGIANGNWDAVIRLLHEDSSGNDTAETLTPSIISGTFAELYDIMQTRAPLILVEYIHPWGYMSAMPIGCVNDAGSTLRLTVAGYFNVFLSNAEFRTVGVLEWNFHDELQWLK